MKPKIDLNQIFFYGGLVFLFAGLVIQFSLGIALIVVGAIMAGSSYLIAWKMAHMSSPINQPEKKDAA